MTTTAQIDNPELNCVQWEIQQRQKHLRTMRDQIHWLTGPEQAPHATIAEIDRIVRRMHLAHTEMKSLMWVAGNPKVHVDPTGRREG